jgi:hypothetical protein
LSRTLTASAIAEVAKLNGVEPIIIIELLGAYYASKDLTLGTISAKGSIISLGALASQKSVDGISEISSMSVELSDVDSEGFRAIIEANVLEGKDCTIYHHFEGLLQADLITVLTGKVSGTISWSEGERKLSFEVISKINSTDVGTFTILNDEEKRWPVVFGKPRDVPAALVQRKPVSKLTQYYDLINAPDTMTVEDGTRFPQTGTITVDILGILIEGTMSDNEFTVTDFNISRYTNLSIEDRAFNHIADPDYDDPHVVWLDETADLVGMWCYSTIASDEHRINYCWKQEGNKCWFVYAWTDKTGATVLLTDTDQIDDVAKVGRATWDYSGAVLSQPTTTALLVMIFFPVPWGLTGFNIDCIVTQVDGVDDDIYVANYYPSTSVTRIIGKQDGKLVIIPSSLYTVDLSNETFDATLTPTTITFGTPLKLQGYDEEIWVTLVSSKSDNSAECIETILNDFTDLTPDTTTFTAVKTLVDKYPCNFAILDQKDAIDAVREIAWQSRCGLVISGDTVKIKYLSVEPSSDATISAADIEMKTLELGFTSIEDVVTYLTGKYKDSYLNDKEKKVVYTNNIDLFGIRKQEYDFYIYQHKSLVEKSLTFWKNRYSNIFRLSKFNTFLTKLKLENFDCATLTLNDYLSIASIKSILQGVSYDISGNTIAFDTMLPSLAGTVTVFADFWMSDTGDVEPDALPVTTVSDPVKVVTNQQIGKRATPDNQLDVDHGPTIGSGGTANIPLDTKGDLLTYDTALAKLGVGTNGQVLTADSDEALGIKWAAPAMVYA